MRNRVRITLLPSGEILEMARGASLGEALFPRGVEFPCGGRGRCGACRVRILEGRLPVTGEDADRLSAGELAAGWRLACRARPEQDLTIEVSQWKAVVLADRASAAGSGEEGLGVAVDLGTTTLAVQLLHLATGEVRGVYTGLNPQALHGADVMSRLTYALSGGGAKELAHRVRTAIGEALSRLLEQAEGGEGGVRRVVIAGNTVMHHLFCGLDPAPLAAYPFESPRLEGRRFSAADLGWPLEGTVPVFFLPCMGGFVGSDLLAGALAVGLHETEAPCMLVDLGTNGEILLAAGGRILCASTAAGPAFEAGGISCGMRAAPGAVYAVEPSERGFRCKVLGGGPARGVCGSALVDAVAAGRALGRIEENGRLAGGASTLSLCDGLRLTQKDVRRLQLAKGAVAAGIRMLLDSAGLAPNHVEAVHLAGAFGNYVDPVSACRIGLFPFPPERIRPAGNTALRGTKEVLALGERSDPLVEAIRERGMHIALAADPRFEAWFMEALAFRAADAGGRET